MKWQIITCIVVFIIKGVFAEDWPKYQMDNQNSGVTTEQLGFPLNESWQWVPRQQPNPAWPAPAKADFWHEKTRLDPRVTYDRAFLISAVGNKVYFATSSDNKIYCLDSQTGLEIWSYYTEAPNRVAPIVYNGNVYVGSDDGFLYCLNATTGSLVWKYSPVEEHRRIPGNGRIISVYPIRTGVLIEDDVLYLVAGLFPKEGVYISAISPSNGNEIWITREKDVSPQGYPVIANKKLYVPNSRSQPLVFDLRNGTLLQKFDGAGGTYISFNDDALIYGTHDSGELSVRETDGSGPLKYALTGLQFVSNKEYFVVASENNLSAINKAQYKNVARQKQELHKQNSELKELVKKLRKKRQKADENSVEEIDKQVYQNIDKIAELGKQLEALQGDEFVWQQSTYRPYSLILSGNNAILGMEGEVAVFDMSSGAKVWQKEVEGRVYGLAAANGNLYASTELGTIYCFGQSTKTVIQKQETIKDVFKGDKVQKKYSQAAEFILESTNITKGYCVVLDCGEGRLAYELAKRSELNIIGIEENIELANKSRQILAKAGLLGNRISIFTGKLDQQNFTSYFANLIVSDKLVNSPVFSTNMKEIYRLLKPGGGTALLGQMGNKTKLSQKDVQDWFAAMGPIEFNVLNKKGVWGQLKRAPLKGAGEWTHLYANASNTASTSDKLVSDATQTLWFGRPGPREMTDRHHRHVSPMYKNGILYIPGDNRIIAADGYNGTVLWENIVPNFRRLAAPRDAGNMTITDDYLYAAVDSRCYGYDVETGEQKLAFVTPQLINRQTRYWGYLASDDDQIFGSGRKPEAAYTLMSKQEDFEIQWGDYKTLVTSDFLFSMDRYKGKVLWTYKNGVVLHPTITIGNGLLYFVENRNAATREDEDGLIDLKTFLGDETYIVAINSKTGKLAWESKYNFADCEHVLYFAYAEGKLLATGSKNKNNQVWYDLYGFDATNGELVWHKEQNNESGIGGDHGEQIRHPVVASGKIYAEPYRYDIHSGELDQDFRLQRGGGGCGTISGSPDHLFFRAANPAMCNVLETEHGSRLNFVTRPGCWINIIPAGGLILIPEASSGCTCNFPLQMSVAYLPVNAQ